MATLNEEKLYVGEFIIDNVPKLHTSLGPDKNRLPPYPNAQNPHPPSQAPFSITVCFEIENVVHSTHGNQKAGICTTPGKACFIANPKGRSQACPDGSYKMEYVDGKWKKPSEQIKESVLPGKYVWFSMKPIMPPEKDGFNSAAYPVSYVHGTAFYGPWSFTFGYTELIDAYSKQIPPGEDVILKNGGTLINKGEVCYVVIVTHSEDQTHRDDKYPILKRSSINDEVLQLRGEYSDPPIFHPRCVPPPSVPSGASPPPQWWGYDFATLEHYDHVVFAVHCDQEGNKFKIDMPAGQPECLLSDPQYDTYKKFHPRCLSADVKECYENELIYWKTLSKEAAAVPSTQESSDDELVKAVAGLEVNK